MYLEFTPSPHLKLCSLKPPNISMKLTLLPLHRTSSHISVAFTPPSTPSFLNPPLLFCDSPAMLKSLGLFQLWLSYKLLIFSDPKISPFCCPKPLLFVGMSIPWAMASTPSLKISESPGWAHIGSPIHLNGNPLQYSCLENSMDRKAWWAIIHGVSKSQTRLSD